MSIPTVAPQALDPLFDFSEGNEEFGVALTDPQRSWSTFRDVLDFEWTQLGGLFEGGVDQTQTVRIPALRACVRRVNRSVAMSLSMARHMEVERASLESMKIRVDVERASLESMKIRVEEAFVQIKSVLG